LLNWDSELGPQKFLAVKGGRTGAPLKELGVWGLRPTFHLHDPSTTTTRRDPQTHYQHHPCKSSGSRLSWIVDKGNRLPIILTLQGILSSSPLGTGFMVFYPHGRLGQVGGGNPSHNGCRYFYETDLNDMAKTAQGQRAVQNLHLHLNRLPATHEEHQQITDYEQYSARWRSSSSFLSK
jgi:hypothetical protein